MEYSSTSSPNVRIFCRIPSVPHDDIVMDMNNVMLAESSIELLVCCTSLLVTYFTSVPFPRFLGLSSDLMGDY